MLPANPAHLGKMFLKKKFANIEVGSIIVLCTGINCSCKPLRFTHLNKTLSLSEGGGGGGGGVYFMEIASNNRYSRLNTGNIMLA